MNHTKQAIIEQFAVLLAEKPYTDITVRDIVERCGINRNTFYYYFEGIPELLISTLENRAYEIIQANGRIESPMDCIQPMVQMALENKQSVFHIYRSVRRDIFMDSLDRIALHIVAAYIDNVTAGMEIKPEGKSLMVRYYKCCCVGILLDWLNSGMEYDVCRDLSTLEPYFHAMNRKAFQDLALK